MRTWYISFNFKDIALNPDINSSNLRVYEQIINKQEKTSVVEVLI